ncbi:zinc finger MYND domain-containing protein 11-like isoform X2 [Saccoglossus kowalevskii]|uniref:Zinc finger MYND domain-containing protein 11-like isoform X1 n=1 Tax=Saccoglossus kowalevskii TaxID=10224 RepID=A0ABM0GMD7_SACKO|nr:PREDICTED: zinc finger MYND domain-containing protein 11-like isoform X1 [Saccoglossus kowalevskii]
MPRVVKRRQCDPVILQQLWEGIRVIRDQKQIANSERITKFMTREYTVSPKEVLKQLNHAVKDGLIIKEISRGCKGSKVGIEQEGFWCIEEQETPSPDEHDWYCFICHKPGEIIRCHGCFRVAHSRCLEKTNKPAPEHGHWYCYVCEVCRKKNHTISRSELSKLLGFTLARMKEKVQILNARELYKKINLGDTPNYHSIIRTHVDLGTIQQKIDDNKYRCLDEFEGDADLMLHNNKVYFGPESERVELCDMVVEDCKHDLNEIRLCKDCYKMSNCRSSKDWFCRPCNPAHELVWAQMKGFGYWPAKVIQRDKDQVDVRFFGGLHQRAWISQTFIKDINTNIKSLRIKATPGWHNACRELRKHQEYFQSTQKKKTDKSEKIQKTGKVHKTHKTRKRKKKETSNACTAQDDAVSSSNVDPIQVSASDQHHVTSSQDSHHCSPASNESQPPTKRRKNTTTSSHSNSNTANNTPSTEDSNTSNASSPAKCDCHEKYSTIFADFKTRLEEDHEKEQKETVKFALDKLREEMEADKQHTVSKVKENMMLEIERAKKQIKEKCKEENDEETSRLEAKYKEEISQTKKKQWCINCEEEAMYHCCWNTSYCSINCQQVHWHKEHKKLCRRKR